MTLGSDVTWRRALGCASSVLALVFPLDAPAQPAGSGVAPAASAREVPPTRAECLAAHVETQKAQAEGELLSSQQHARVCTNSACPAALVIDCSSWLDELEPRIPSLVFEVRLNGELNTSAKIQVDGQPVSEWTSGQALPVNPGAHQIMFTLDAHPPVVHRVLLADGMKYRLVSAEFQSVDPDRSRSSAPVAVPSPIRPAISTRPVPFVVYPLAGLGVVALGSFVAFSLAGNAEYDRLQRSCAPFCSDDEMHSVRTRYLMGDISLGVSALSIAGAAFLYLTRPTIAAAAPTVGFLPLRTGGVAMVTLPTP
ncbi:MAG TPA: hypothetical protein VMG12_38225 [Polyangiaceae bacterium]|nr:hypothetical protein [Polyangiaceae bacterium]